MKDDTLFLQTRDDVFEDLYLCFCGYERCVPLHSWGPGVRPGYLLHFVLSGKGVFREGSFSRQLGEGDGFLIEPRRTVFYQADREDPWTYLWVGFDGRLAPEVVAQMGLGDGTDVFRCRSIGPIRDCIREMFRYDKHSAVHRLCLESLLFRLFACMTEEICVDEPRRQGNVKNDYVGGAVQYIRKNYANNMHIQDLADYVGVDRSYLFTLFKRETGMSPAEYLKTFRLTLAAEMLTETRYPVENIAHSCGYADPLVFSKAFKRKYGVPPMKFRRLDQEKNLTGSLYRGADGFPGTGK